MKLLAALRKNPVDFPTAIASLAAHPEVAISFEYSPAGLSEIQRQNQVHSLTIDELFSQEQAISEKKRKAVKEYAAQTLGKWLTFGTLRRDWMLEPVYRHTTRHDARGLVMVDLELPEHLLKKQFEEWLVEMRAPTNTTGHQDILVHPVRSGSTWDCSHVLICSYGHRKKTLRFLCTTSPLQSIRARLSKRTLCEKPLFL